MPLAHPKSLRSFGHVWTEESQIVWTSSRPVTLWLSSQVTTLISADQVVLAIQQVPLSWSLVAPSATDGIWSLNSCDTFHVTSCYHIHKL